MESDFIKSVSWTTEKNNDQDWVNRTGHVSASALKKIKVSPAHFIEEEKKEITDAMIFGKAYHKYILEPETFENDYFVLNERDILEKLIGEGTKSPRATNAYKEWMQAQMNMAQGKEMLDQVTLDKLKAMKDRLFNNRYASILLNKGEAEQSFYCNVKTFEDKDIKLIMRTDYIKRNKRAIIELKTTTDASKEGFPRECAEYDYHIQAAIYKDLMEKITQDTIPWTFLFVAQETKKPYAFNIFEASGQFISQGRYEYEQLILLFQMCQENNHWPGYQIWCQNQFGINEINLPSWAIKDLTFYNHKR